MAGSLVRFPPQSLRSYRPFQLRLFHDLAAGGNLPARCNAKGGLLPYLVVMTVLGFSAFWEIIEAWIGQIAHPDLEQALVGHQGDMWDPQQDMASALYGSVLYVSILAIGRKLHETDGESSSMCGETPELEAR